MAEIFNPWATPPTEGTLSGDLASFEINDMEGPEESEHGENKGPMAEALKVISEQSQLISKLMKMLGSGGALDTTDTTDTADADTANATSDSYEDL